MIGDEGQNHPDIEKAGPLIGSQIATLLNRGYQMFFETPDGKRFPAIAGQLKALHEFEDDVKESLDLVNLYNTSLGTTTPKAHVRSCLPPRYRHSTQALGRERQ